MKRFALIDGDIIVYRIAARVEADQGDLLDLWTQIEETVEEWTRAAGCNEAVVCLSAQCPEGVRSFRSMIYPPYKANRLDAPKPEFLEDAKMAIRELYPDYKEQDLLEGDDVIGILAGNMSPGMFVVVSVDKDLLQIPGDHYNPITETKKYVSIDEARAFWIEQWIRGDSTDNFGGVRGMGPKKTHLWLQEFWTECGGEFQVDKALAAVLELYAERGYDDTYIAQMNYCSTILQEATDPQKLVEQFRETYPDWAVASK